MSNGVKGKGKASGQEGLQKAIERAWEDASAKKGPPGMYEVEKIQVDCINPIRAYIVTIVPTGP